MFRKNCIVFFVSSILALAFAYVLEYVFNFIPCELCFYERIPYFVVLLISVVCYIKPNKYFVFLMYLSYFLNIVLSFYHSGLEHTWFSDILGCTESSITPLDTFEGVKDALLNSNNLISCAKRTVFFLGLSLAELNTLYCIISLIIAYSLRRRFYEKG